MRVLIDKLVQTETATYAFPTREEAEAFYLSLKRERPAAEDAPAGDADSSAVRGSGGAPPSGRKKILG